MRPDAHFLRPGLFDEKLNYFNVERWCFFFVAWNKWKIGIVYSMEFFFFFLHFDPFEYRWMGVEIKGKFGKDVSEECKLL